MERLKACYAAYIAAAERAEENSSKWNGAFGIGESTKYHPCHDSFYKVMEKWSKAFVEQNPTQAQAEEAVRFIFETTEEYRDTIVYWYMFAAHGFTRPLIPRVSREFAAEMLAFYNTHYPRHYRMPVQQEVFKLLKKQGKA